MDEWRGEMRMDFGGRIAYNCGDALAGKSSEGEQHGQEIEEGEEDRTDQAAEKAVRTSFMVRSTRTRSADRA
jgi:hypothetical protein